LHTCSLFLHRFVAYWNQINRTKNVRRYGMFKRHRVARALYSLMALCLLVAGGVGIYRAGWWRGYQMAQWEAEEGEGEMTPHFGFPRTFGPMPHGLGVPRVSWRFGSGLLRMGALLTLLFPVLALLAGLAAITAFRLCAHKLACGHGDAYVNWHGRMQTRHWKVRHGQKTEDEPSESDEDGSSV
jgi:hypothetical protein